MRRSITPVLVALLIGAPLLGLSATVRPDGVAAAAPTPSAPMRVRFEAGTHVGYQFSSTGAILATKSATLLRPSGADTTRRATIPGRGVHLLITNGIWAGYYVPESIVAHVVGIVSQTPYTPARRLVFPAGDVIGYRFDGAWALTSAKVVRLARDSGASASMAAAINGITYYAIVDGAFAGTWVPAGAAGAVRPLACRTGSRATGGAAIWAQLAGAGPEVALTFDLGGRTDPAMVIAKRLLLFGACSTIFPTGDTAQTPAGQAVLEFMDDYPQVFEFGNHTQNHCDLANGGGGAGCPADPSAAFIQSELTSANSVIAAVTGQSTPPYWRPPYGAHDAFARSAAAGVGYTKTVMWHVDTIDWRPPPPADTGPTAPQIIAKVVGNVGNGSIVLAHLGGYNTYDALPGIVRGLQLRGLQATSLSDLADGQ